MNRIFFTILCLITQISIAGTSGIIDTTNCNNGFVAAISGGPTWSNTSKTERFYLQPDVEKKYVADKGVETKAMGELFFGIQKYIEQGFNGQIGFAFALSDNKLKGEIWDDAQAIFNNYTYNYKVNSTRYAIKGKFLIDSYFDSQVYLSASAGVSMNRSRNFTITPRIVPAISAPAFISNTESAFAYSLGAGIQKEIINNINIGIGYDFNDWGRYHLGRAPGQTLNNGLGHSHLYTHALMFTLSFLFR